MRPDAWRKETDMYNPGFFIHVREMEPAMAANTPVTPQEQAAYVAWREAHLEHVKLQAGLAAAQQKESSAMADVLKIVEAQLAK
jgi:hypothetical protein